jgi:hypothetical protein
MVRRTFGVAVLALDCGQLEVQPIAEVLLDGVAIEVLAARPQVSAGRGVAFERRPQRQRAAIPLRARVDAPAHQKQQLGRPRPGVGQREVGDRGEYEASAGFAYCRCPAACAGRRTSGGGDWPWTDRANFFDGVFNKVEALRSAG